MPSSSSRIPRRRLINVIGSAIIPLLIVFLTGVSIKTSHVVGIVTALSSSSSSSSSSSNYRSATSTRPDNIIAITHAAGRMGKVLALQLREDAELRYRSRSATKNDDDDDNDNDNGDNAKSHLPKIRAIVRSEKEAYSVRCDLGGMTMVGGCIAKPIALDWLETVVIESNAVDSERTALLREAFEGCRAAILCDASHNELVWKENDNDDDKDNDNDNNDNTNSGFSVNVPASENKDLTKRLLEEIDAASHSSTLEHVVLRSSMGLAVDAHRLYQSQNNKKPPLTILPFFDDDCEVKIDWAALAKAMGGEAALAGPREAERAFRKMAELELEPKNNNNDNSGGVSAKQRKRKRKHTILRLGALTDDAGMVPLVFGSNDSILVKTTDDGTSNYRPPILSRSDAARVSTFLVRNDDDDDKENDDDAINGNHNNDSNIDSNNNNLTTIDCAWHPKYGRDSVGREETISAAGRQDLNKAILKALPEQQQQQPTAFIS